MKIAMLHDKDAYIRHTQQMIDGITVNIEIGMITLEGMRNGVGKEEWLNMNYISEPYREAEWQRHIEWKEDDIKCLRRKVKRLLKCIENAKQCVG